jgi:hypothetical protein
MRLNGEGKRLYRLGQWGEAREKYRAALAADPQFLWAQLNLACTFSRQERYAEAADEAAKLIRQAFVPWSREVLEAADLGILQDRSDYQLIEAARAEAGPAWGRRAQGGVLFVARIKPAINLEGQGVLVLSLAQELFAWIPETGRYFQLSAEDGRLLAFVRSPDGRRVAYLLAGKLARSPGHTAYLRDLGLRVLDLSTMSASKVVSIPTDARQVRIWFSAAPNLSVTDASGKITHYRLLADVLEPGLEARPPGKLDSVVLSDAGVAQAGQRQSRPGCPFTLAPREGGDGIWRIQVARAGSKPFFLDAKYGAGLAGLPFPSKTAIPSDRRSGQSATK